MIFSLHFSCVDICCSKRNLSTTFESMTGGISSAIIKIFICHIICFMTGVSTDFDVCRGQQDL